MTDITEQDEERFEQAVWRWAKRIAFAVALVAAIMFMWFLP